MMLQLIFAVLLGAMLGIEREWQAKPAGLRTYALVSLGACLFTIISIDGFRQFIGSGASYDPARIASQIVIGIGFIGGGSIFLKNDLVHGLTTAAGLWIAAAVGMTVGVKFYALALFAAIMTVLILDTFSWAERNIIKTKK